MRSKSRLYITTQMAECYWSEVSSPSFVGHHYRDTRNNRDREKSSGQANLFNVWTISSPLTELQVNLRTTWVCCAVILCISSLRVQYIFSMKETPRRRIMFLSSFYEIATNQLGNCVGEKRCSTRRHLFLQADFWTIYKDDVNSFSCTPRIFALW
jgi:hypothetical protein